MFQKTKVHRYIIYPTLTTSQWIGAEGAQNLDRREVNLGGRVAVADEGADIQDASCYEFQFLGPRSELRTT